MHISINTAEEISDLDRQVLGILAGGSFTLGEPGETFNEEVESEPEPEPVAKKAPAKKAPAKKAAAKKPEPEPEPMAEEAVEEDDVLGEEDAGEDDLSDEDLLELAVKKATEMVGAGQAAQVREALDAAGASRVRELNADNVRDFFQALP